MGANKLEVKSSVLYQILLYLHCWYFFTFIILELLIFIYKWIILPYPAGNIAAELILLIFLTVIECTRNFFGRKGNLTEHNLAVILSLALTVPSVFGVLYYTLWQTYVLKLEVILTGIQLALTAIQTIIGLICLVKFSK